MVVHSVQGSVYASKSFNELLPMYCVFHSMSRAGTPTDTAAMEAINGWIKAELLMDFHVMGNECIDQEINDYIVFFNEQRPAYSMNHITPQQYQKRFLPSQVCCCLLNFHSKRADLNAQEIYGKRQAEPRLVRDSCS